jgi:hypothetical protein
VISWFQAFAFKCNLCRYIEFMKKHGFWGLVAMSAWPNAAFDLCGICCGTFMMPFWQFFGATFVGKGLIKVGAVQPDAFQSLYHILLLFLSLKCPLPRCPLCAQLITKLSNASTCAATSRRRARGRCSPPCSARARATRRWR